MSLRFEPEQLEIEIDAGKLSVDINQVFSGLSMTKDDADEYLLGLIQNLMITCKELALPRAGFSILYDPLFETKEKVLKIADKEFQLGKTITAMLKKSEAVVFFVATIGDKVEALSKKYMKEGDALEGYIIDLIGSELAESATDYLHNYLQNLVESIGYGLSNRYSPGYCNWPVSDQQQLFELMHPVNCGISLNESFLMTPAKSVSGLMGIGKGMKRVDYKCRLCDDDKCILRHQF